MRHLDIINRALVAAGTNPRSDMEDTSDNEVSSVRAYYETCWKDVLASHPWSELQVEEELAGVEEGLKYRFELPESCIRISSMLNAYGTEAYDVKRVGRYLYSEHDTLLLTYVSTQEILPVDWDFVDYDITIDIPPALDEVVSLRLASQIVFRISQNLDLQGQLYSRYMIALQNAKLNDMHGDGGMDFISTGVAEWES